MTLAELLHGLVDRVFGWNTRPEMHKAIDEHFAAPAPAPAEAPPETPEPPSTPPAPPGAA